MAGAKSAGYKLATYKSSDGPRAGVIIGELGADGDEVRERAGGERCEVPGHGVR